MTDPAMLQPDLVSPLFAWVTIGLVGIVYLTMSVFYGKGGKRK